MKKFWAMLLASMMALSLGACNNQTPTEPTPPVEKNEIKTGTGTTRGFGGDVTVSVTVEGNKLTDVEIEGLNESLTIGSVVVNEMGQKMVDANSIDVDSYSGATVTSAAVKSAAKKALEDAGVDKETLIPNETKELSTEKVTTDVLVIGGGGAGIAAAVAAKEEGKDVVLLEKLSILGGNTALSGGVITRAATEGDPEGTMTADELYDFYMETTGGEPDPEVVRRYVDESVETTKWVHSMGSGVGETARFRTTPETIMAIQPAKNSGRGLMAPMIEEVHNAGVDVRLNMVADELIVENNRVVGVKAKNKDGKTQEFYANQGVILATGGFPANKELLAKYSTLGADQAYTMCSVGTVGDGLLMGEKIGAAVRFGEDWDNIGSNTQLSAPYMVAFPQLYALMVNSSGKRFISEDAQRPTIYNEMLHQIAAGEDGFYFVFDQNTVGEGYEAFVESGDAFVADTIEELAEKMNVPTEEFEKTVNRYNELINQEDPDFNKPSKFMLGVQEGPFIAAKTWPLRTSTIGGLVIDKDAHVLDDNDQTIDGLYAAGEVANYSFFHSVYSTCGSAVGHAVIYGRIAGRNAANGQ